MEVRVGGVGPASFMFIYLFYEHKDNDVTPKVSRRHSSRNEARELAK